ncbi:MAG: HlyD family efflux transporter periplasmic adaptor subunit [Methylococcales bacterium]
MTKKFEEILFLVFFVLILPDSVVAQQGLVTAQAAVKTVKLTGFTRARTVLTLATEISGKVEKILVDVGDPIPKNRQFACLDETFINLDIAENQAELRRVDAEVTYFKKQVSRHQMLITHNSTAQSQLDDVERSYAISRSQYAALTVKGKRLKERKKRHCTTAPVGWNVIERSVEPGQWLDVGDRIGTVGDFSQMLIPLALSMAEYQVIRKSANRLQIQLLDMNATVPAHLERVSPAFDEQSRKIMIDLQVGKGISERRGGLRAQLILNIPIQTGAVVVPENAIQKRYEEYWLTRSNGKEIKVNYLGRNDENRGDGVARAKVVSPDVHPGDQFRIRDQAK